MSRSWGSLALPTLPHREGFLREKGSRQNRKDWRARILGGQKGRPPIPQKKEQKKRLQLQKQQTVPVAIGHKLHKSVSVWGSCGHY